jgi:hypothetical protein
MMIESTVANPNSSLSGDPVIDSVWDTRGEQPRETMVRQAREIAVLSALLNSARQQPEVLTLRMANSELARTVADLQDLFHKLLNETAERIRPAVFLEIVRAAALVERAWYLAEHRDVSAQGMDPEEHFAKYGWLEKRIPHPIFNPPAQSIPAVSHPFSG